MPEVVIVKNLSDKVFEGKYNSRRFRIPAGGDALLDREAAVIWFGDWDARNVGNNPAGHFRTQEYERIRALYGSHFDDRVQDEGWVIEKALKMDQKWDLYRPHIEIYEQDEEGKSHRVVTVIEDPTGEALPITDTANVDLGSVVESQQAQINAMQEALDALRSQTSKAPVDSPERAPKRGRAPIMPEPVREEAVD